MYDTTRLYNLLEGSNPVFYYFYHFLVSSMKRGPQSEASTNFNSTKIIGIASSVQS